MNSKFPATNSNHINFSSNYDAWTAPQNGWFRFTYSSGKMSTGTITINNIAFCQTDWRNEWNCGNGYVTWPLRGGDVVRGTITAGLYLFFPVD